MAALGAGPAESASGSKRAWYAAEERDRRWAPADRQSASEWHAEHDWPLKLGPVLFPAEDFQELLRAAQNLPVLGLREVIGSPKTLASN